MTDRQTRKVKIRVAKAERSRTNKATPFRKPGKFDTALVRKRFPVSSKKTFDLTGKNPADGDSN